MNRQTQTLIVGLLFFIFALGFYLYLQRGNASPTPPKEVQKPAEQPKKQEGQKKELLYYGERSSGAVTLWSITSNTKEKKKIFTDFDEELKIKSAGNITADGKWILVNMGPKNEDVATQHFLIGTDGKGEKRQIASDLASTEPPQISPDGTMFLWVGFSNVEADYGFTLTLQRIDGTNKRVVMRLPTEILTPAFSPDGKNIAAVKVLADDKEEIVRIATSDFTSETLLKIEKNRVYGLSFEGENILLSVGPKDEAKLNEAEINILDRKTKSMKALTSNSKFESTPIASPDEKYIAYIAKMVEAGKGLKDTQGDIVILNKDTKEETTIAQGAFVIGWGL